LTKEVVMPALEMAQDTGLLIRWLKNEGEQVNQGEPLMEIETDKAIMEIEAPATGILSEVTAKPGEEIPVGQVIALLVPSNKTSKKRQVSTQKNHSLSKESLQKDSGTLPIESPAQCDEDSVKSPPRNPRKILASPKARRLAREYGVDLSNISGSGPGGAILATDFLNPQTAPDKMSSEEEYSVVPIQGMRKVIAERMQSSYKTAPHISLSLSINMNKLQELRHHVNETAQKLSRTSLKLTPILCKAISLALLKFPRLNAQLVGNEIREFKSINLAVAVSLEEGLLVPVIRGIENKGLPEIQSELQDLVKRAQQRLLKPEEMKNSTFTFSNLGMYDIEEFSSILNPPEVGILSVGVIKEKPISIDSCVVVRHVMKVTLNADHRAVDGAVAAQFLRYLRELLENPSLLGL